MRLFALFLCALLWALPLRADTVPAVPEAVLKRISGAPDRFLDQAALMIYGFGAKGSVDAAGIERSIAFDRAGARASALRRLLAADLDNDGAITADELAVAAGATGAGPRARLITTHASADADGNGVVSGAELATHAEAESLERVPETRAALARAVLACDEDGDGQVSLTEVKRALAAIDEAA